MKAAEILEITPEERAGNLVGAAKKLGLSMQREDAENLVRAAEIIEQVDEQKHKDDLE